MRVSGTRDARSTFKEATLAIPIAIVGCGGMGGRHLLGIKELYDSGLGNVRLEAVCDLRRDNAEHLADQAEALLGRRPEVFDDLLAMRAAMSELEAVSITTDARAHHTVACTALDMGVHVLCEKPLALTVRGCNHILAAQRRSGKLVSVAENYRRDPMSRLTKALLLAGAIGVPQLYLDIGASSGNRIIITPWRHQKLMGGMLLDGGVHNADMMLYYMGSPRQVYARIKLWETVRVKPRGDGGVSGFYERWFGEMPDAIEATAEDTLTSVIDFADGAMGQWTQSYAAHGRGFGHRVIYGSLGSLVPGGTRNGISPVLTLDDGEPLSGDPLLDLVPDYRLDAISAALFGGNRLASYDIAFPEADRKLLAIEYHEFGECIEQGREPEVNAEVGRRAAAVCYAAFESSLRNRPVTPEEIEREAVGDYEAEINADLGLHR
jgi:predicted dehydrogenase